MIRCWGDWRLVHRLLPPGRVPVHLSRDLRFAALSGWLEGRVRGRNPLERIMTAPRRFVVLTLVSALASPAYALQKKVEDADAKEIAAYRLTTAALTKVLTVNRAMVAQVQHDPKVQEALKVAKAIDALEAKDELTEAEQKQLETLHERQEQLEDSADNPLGGDTKSLSEMEARIREYPPLMQALQKEGMAPREYAKFWMAFIQAAFVQGFKKSGMLKEIPPEVNPDNVKFIEEHAAEIEAMQKEFEALGKDKQPPPF
jgi:hypothetical protein